MHIKKNRFLAHLNRKRNTELCDQTQSVKSKKEEEERNQKEYIKERDKTDIKHHRLPLCHALSIGSSNTITKI